MTPRREDLPEGYADLWDWYGEWERKGAEERTKSDPLLKAIGSGKHIWADETPDEYINRLREGWE